MLAAANLALGFSLLFNVSAQADEEILTPFDAMVKECGEEVNPDCYGRLMCNYNDKDTLKYIKTWPPKKLYALALINGLRRGYNTHYCNMVFAEDEDKAARLDLEIGKITGPPPSDPDKNNSLSENNNFFLTMNSEWAQNPPKPVQVTLRQATGYFGEYVTGGNAIRSLIFYPTDGLPPLLVIEDHATLWLTPRKPAIEEKPRKKVRIHYSLYSTLKNGYAHYYISKVASLKGTPEPLTGGRAGPSGHSALFAPAKP